MTEEGISPGNKPVLGYVEMLRAARAALKSSLSGRRRCRRPFAERLVEGGAIDSVQRIAMKSTEQDRGNALIAVPAKITDDFHMIALNDFPDAMKTNLELLKSRNWIDIPITYRNGRRALMTLDKGTAGAEAFDTVMKAWTTAAAANP